MLDLGRNQNPALVLPLAPVRQADAAVVIKIFDSADHQPDFDADDIHVGQPPFVEGAVDANMPGGIFERMAQTGVSIEFNGTCVGPLSKRQPTGVDHTTDAESSAACTAGKLCRFVRTFMDDLGIPLQGPISLAEDNSATRDIAHGGKVTSNMRHLAVRTHSLMDLVRFGYILLRKVKSCFNRADHYTKLLPKPAFELHTHHSLGLRFLTHEHLCLYHHHLYGKSTSD